MHKIDTLDQLGISYEIRKGNYKRIVIGYYHKRSLTIKMPINMPMLKLDKFINDNIDWIKNKQPQGYFNAVKYQNGEKYLFLGKEYHLEIFASKYPQIEIIKNRLVVYSPSLDEATIKKNINIWRLKQAELVFQEILNKCFKEMNHYLSKYPVLEIKKYKSRWGCCYPQRNKIIINISVVNLPIHLIEYVIYHELSHFIYLNHSKEFHNLLSKFVFDEKKIIKEISKYNPVYE